MTRETTNSEPLHPPLLRTERLCLRPFTDMDADAIYALQSNAYVLRYWDSPPWRERARAERFTHSSAGPA